MSLATLWSGLVNNIPLLSAFKSSLSAQRMLDLSAQRMLDLYLQIRGTKNGTFSRYRPKGLP